LERTPDEWQELSHREVAINKNRLDDEASGQSQLYSNWGSLAAAAHIYRKRKEGDYEEVKAAMDIMVRTNPTEYGVEEKSPKEAAIKAAIISNREVKKAHSDFLDAYAYDKILAVAEKSCEGRKSMLRLTGDLWLGEYFSTVTVKEKQAEEFREKISDTKNRSRRRIKKHG